MSDTKNANQERAEPSKGFARFKRIGVSFVVVVVALYVAAASFMYVKQRDFLFVPYGQLVEPGEKGLENVTVETVEMADGTRVTVWTAPPKTEGAPTALYYHGNSSNLAARSPRFKQILDSGYGLYAPTYRGYAGSEGSPSEAALLSDALEHYDRLAKSTDNIVVVGESLGTGVATATVRQRNNVKMLVLDSPYTALLDIASNRYPWLPVSLLMKDPMLTRERIADVTVPVLVFHGTDDRVIPVDHGRSVFAVANEPKELFILEGAGHSDLWRRGLWDTVTKAYGEMLGRVDELGSGVARD